MFVVLVGASGPRSCSSATVAAPARPTTCSPAWSIAWLWFTVLFANFAEAVAEGRGKAQADTLRKTRSETVAHCRQPDGSTVDEVPSSQAATSATGASS